jgi:hypothetical protein
MLVLHHNRVDGLVSHPLGLDAWCLRVRRCKCVLLPFILGSALSVQLRNLEPVRVADTSDSRHIAGAFGGAGRQ